MARRAGTSAAADDGTPEARPWGRTRRGARCGHRFARAGGGNPGACGERQPAPDWRGAADTEARCRREALRHRACQRSACADGGVAGAQPSSRAAGGGAPRGLSSFAQPDFAGALERGGENSGRVRGRPETASGRRTGRRAHSNRRRRRRDSGDNSKPKRARRLASAGALRPAKSCWSAWRR